MFTFCKHQSPQAAVRLDFLRLRIVNAAPFFIPAIKKQRYNNIFVFTKMPKTTIYRYKNENKIAIYNSPKNGFGSVGSLPIRTSKCK